MRVAVMGSTGYTGRTLLRLLLTHPSIRCIYPVSVSAEAVPVNSRDPGLGSHSLGKLAEGGVYFSRKEALDARPDAVFSALPSGKSADFCAPFFGNSVIIDLSADLRIRDARVHHHTYGVKAPAPQWRSQAVYGLTELSNESIMKTNIIAVPGCYPTCILLPLMPLIKENLITGAITVNAMSGISGMGKAPKDSSMYVECAESVRAYNPGTLHRHVPEMRQQFIAGGYQFPLYFAPHLVPMRRGMAATITVHLKNTSENSERTTCALQAQYEQSPFIQLRYNQIPDTRDVLGSNRCDIGWHIADDGVLYLFSVIDNLLKGAAGQAVQNFNIRFGLPETAGLPRSNAV